MHAKLALGERIHSLGQFGSFEQNAGDALLALEQAVEQGVGAPRWRAARGPDAVDARLERSRAWWRASAFERYILGTLGDAVELAHGVEGRPPFLDGGVQRACARIAPSEFMRGGVEKQALRRALDGVLPASTLARRKQPFFASPMLLSERPGCLLALARATLTGPTAPAFDPLLGKLAL